MPTTASLPIKSLNIDLKNFRTVPQADEISAVRAMISINPDWFWALMESLLEDGYHLTENIIVQKSGKKSFVREGNRRIGALKLIHGYLADPEITLPTHIAAKVEKLQTAWKRSNKDVPCAVYEESETDLVDKVVALTHGKGEKAGRDKWNAVAKARHNRDKSGASEPALDLLEKYLKKGRNVTTQQAERWSGDYPLTVLDEAIKRIAQRLGFVTSRALADSYPRESKHREVIEKIISDVGLQALDFASLRSQQNDFVFDRYGVAPIDSSFKNGAKKSVADTSKSIESPSLQSKIPKVNPLAQAAKSKKTAAVPVHSLIYLDPPYFKKADRLYLNHYSPNDHERIAAVIQQSVNHKWIVSYDNAPEITQYYLKRRSFEYDLQYNASKAYMGKEIIIVSDDLVIPASSNVLGVNNALQRMTPQFLIPKARANKRAVAVT